MVILDLYLVTIIFSILTIMLIFYALNNNEEFQNKMLDTMMKSEESGQEPPQSKVVDFIVSIYFFVPILNIIASIALLTTLYSKKQN
ncbi:hypothetical protein [Clostridium ihumii]|uniref:hypothetical protein n=1 Tax=Clostridium ihumii TaxID=1470356 RepID=UPI00058C330A|nr:hypothetical protein [Clostridium ihumii]